MEDSKKLDNIKIGLAILAFITGLISIPLSYVLWIMVLLYIHASAVIWLWFWLFAGIMILLQIITSVFKFLSK